jgi:hypothetical protein
MPTLAYNTVVSGKVVVWLRGDVKTPPFSREARIEAGCLLRRLQDGESLTMPHSKPMKEIGTKLPRAASD